MTIKIPKPADQTANNTAPSGKKMTVPNLSAGTGSEYLTLKQVAKKLQVCTKTARNIIKDYRIPVLRVGRRRQIRVHRSHLELFMEKDW